MALIWQWGTSYLEGKGFHRTYLDLGATRVRGLFRLFHIMASLTVATFRLDDNEARTLLVVWTQFPDVRESVFFRGP